MRNKQFSSEKALPWERSSGLENVHSGPNMLKAVKTSLVWGFIFKRFRKCFPLQNFQIFSSPGLSWWNFLKSKAVPPSDKGCTTPCLQFRVSYPLAFAEEKGEVAWIRAETCRGLGWFIPHVQGPDFLSTELTSTHPGCIKQAWDDMPVIPRWAVRAL